MHMLYMVRSGIYLGRTTL